MDRKYRTYLLVKHFKLERRLLDKYMFDVLVSEVATKRAIIKLWATITARLFRQRSVGQPYPELAMELGEARCKSRESLRCGCLEGGFQKYNLFTIQELVVQGEPIVAFRIRVQNQIKMRRFFPLNFVEAMYCDKKEKHIEQ